MPAPTPTLIDHTLLKPDATSDQVTTLADEAKNHGFFSVCVNPTWVRLAAQLLAGSDVKVCTVVGFPLGASTTATKAFETRDAVADGADEVDMVINVGWARQGDWDAVTDDIRAVVDAAGPDTLVKVIIETCLLTEEQKVEASRAAVRAGADYVKTSTGFSTGGATAADVALMRATVGPAIGVKASGGIRTPQDLRAMVEAGASRVGASAGSALFEEELAC